MAIDFYDNTSAETAEMLKKMQVYTELAIRQGDAIYPGRNEGELIIKVRVDKKKENKHVQE